MGASQKSAGCVGCVHLVCRLKSGVQKGRSLPLRVWPHVVVDVLRAPSGQAVAPGLLSECRGLSHRSLVVSLLLRSSSKSVADRAFKIQRQGPEGPVVFVAVAPGLVYECRGRATPARIQGARAALPMTSMQVECGKNDHPITRTPEHEEH